MSPPTPSRAGAASRPRSRKLGKRQQERAARAFTDACLEAFRQLGAVPDLEHCLEPVGDLHLDLWGTNHVRIETKIGVLRMAPDPSDEGHGGTIFCVFDEPARAAALLGDNLRYGGVPRLNPHSGKWHHYYFDTQDSTLIVEDFVRSVRPLLKESP